MKKHLSHSLTETAEIAREWLRGIAAEEPLPGAQVVGLSGHLGAGKTAFAKALARELGVAEEITSPTFVIMKSYITTHPRWKRLVHIDAYRLDRAEELYVLEFESIVANPSHLVLIEWPEHVAAAVVDLKGYTTLEFSIIAEDQDSRSIAEMERKPGKD